MDSRYGIDTSGQTERQGRCSFCRGLWREEGDMWEARKEEV